MSDTISPLPAPAPAPAPSPAQPAPTPAPEPAPIPMPNQIGAEQFTIGHGQTVTVETLPDVGAGDSIVLLSQPLGTLSLVNGYVNIDNGNGSATLAAGMIDYTAPSSVTSGEVDAFSYEVLSPTGSVLSVNDVSATLDPGPTVTTLNATFGAGQTLDLTSLLPYLASPGLPGDQLTLQSFVVSPGVGGDGSGAGKVIEQGTAGTGNDLVFTAPASGAGFIQYTVADQAGDTATGTINFNVDPGPTVAQQTTYVVGHGQTANLLLYVESLVAPGQSGDRVQITGASDNRGTVTFQSEKGATTGITFTGVNTDAGGAGVQDVLTYTAIDTFTSLAATQGDATEVVEGKSAPVSGTVRLVVDQGPTAATVTDTLQTGATVDLTSAILGAITPGLSGDQITLTAIGTADTTGAVTLSNGDVTYTGSAPGADSFTYTATDQYGDTAVGTVDLSVAAASVLPAPTSVITGGTYGSTTIQGVDGPEQITGYGYGNTIYANGGSGTIVAGAGGDTVVAGSGTLAITLAGYNNQVSGGDGSDTVSGSQGTTSVTLGNGNDTISLAGYQNTITLGNGNDTVNAGAGNLNVVVGNGNDAITAAGNQNTIAIGRGNDTVVAGTGGDTVTGGGGTDTITLAGYGNQVTLTAGDNTISGGAGSDTVSLTGGNANLLLNGYSDMVFLSNANATIDDMAQGLHVAVAGGGTDVIQNAASDPSLLIDLQGGLGGYSSATAAYSALTSDGHGGAMLSLGTSGSIDILGIAPSHLSASNFQIG